MTSRRATPNLLDPMSEVMGARKEENHNAIKHKSHSDGKQENIKATKEDSLERERVEGLKEKATYNLSKDLLNEIEETWITLRRNLRGQRVTKTMIVEEAIQFAIEDLAKNKSKSWLYRKIESNKTSQQ